FIYIYFFSFYYSLIHLDFHSFPTRRSSDLEGLFRMIPRSFTPTKNTATWAENCGSTYFASSTCWRVSRPVLPKFPIQTGRDTRQDRKSTRLNSSHSQISYAVFCLKKKKKIK